MKTIGVFGRKGGSGKTLVSHMLSHGLSLLNYRPIMLQTDVRTFRPPEIVDGRNYILATTSNDETDETKIKKLFQMFGNHDSAALVIDGGANRRKMDLFFAPLCDLILIPTGFSEEDIAIAEDDFEELTEALEQRKVPTEVFIICNRWPGVSKKHEMIIAKKWVKDFLKRSERRGNLFPHFVPDMASFIDMANGASPKYTQLINAKSKSLSNLVAQKIAMIRGEEFVLPEDDSTLDDEIEEQEMLRKHRDAAE